MQHYWLLIFLKFIIISFFVYFVFFCENAVEVFLFRNRTLTDRMSIRIYFYPGNDDDEAEADEDDDQAIQRNFPSIHT